MNKYTKLLADLVNVDVEIEEEDNAVILPNSLPDEEYETILTLINDKQILNYSDVSLAHVNYEMRKKNKQSSSKSDSVEALTVKGKSSSKKGKSDRQSSDRVLRDLKN